MNFIKNIGWPELLVLGIIIIIFFGAGKVKELSAGLGESIKEVKKIKKDLKSDDSSEGGVA